MPAENRDLKQWTFTFETAAWALLAPWVGPEDRDNYPVRAEPCEKHGGSCARVIYGMLQEHLTWAEHEPVALAGRLVATMLPQGAGHRATSPQ